MTYDAPDKVAPHDEVGVPSQPRWPRVAVFCALAYFALGQLHLALVYPRFDWLPPQGWGTRHVDVGLLAIGLLSMLPALARHPHAPRWAAYSAGAAAAGGLGLHLIGRWLLWPGLQGGCWVHTVEEGGLPDRVCADLVPPHWDQAELMRLLLAWPALSMALAFLLGAVVIGLRALVRQGPKVRAGT